MCGRVQRDPRSPLRGRRGKRGSRRQGGVAKQRESQGDEPFPWRQWMRIGLGGLGWRPAEFWAATLTEFFEAINGHNEAQEPEHPEKAPSADEMAELMAKYG
ncbi:phage tail assembly chaperone [Rhizobium sp. BE258]|uniref:phage tail assembly chaperone n=1 Tax=Rhizobium sp. BE258 TaxID=2817722 RepID=UPI00286C5220|nr:phage tail assembly chaperone [Rhizobium sp. BE258]